MPQEIGAPVSASAARMKSSEPIVELGAAQVVAVAALAPVAERVGRIPRRARGGDGGGPGVAGHAALGPAVDGSCTRRPYPPRAAACSTRARWSDVRRSDAPRYAADAADDRRRPVDHRRRAHDVLAQPELLRVEPEREPDELGEVQHRHAERAADDLLGQRLLQVEVEVAERARGDEAVGVGVQRVAEVPAGLLQRRLAVHRDDREAAALVLAGVVDHRAAERLDQLVQVGVARVLAVDARGGPSGGRCSSRRTGRRAGRSAGARPWRRPRRARSPRPSATGSACW